MSEFSRDPSQKDAILDAALIAIAEHKISDITMRDIAKSAGISNGALHYYFPSKKELLLSLLNKVDQMFNEPRETDFAEHGLTLSEKLRRFFDGQHDLNEQKVTEVFIDFWGQGLKDPIFQAKIQNIYNNWRGAIKEIIQEGIDQQEFDPNLSRYFPHLICSIIEGASLQYLIDDDDLDLDEYFTFAFGIIYGGLIGTNKLREPYPSDLTDAQWEKIASLMPEQSSVGRPRSINYREIINAILYVIETGCTWRMLPHDFHHWKSVYGYYNKWNKDKTLGQIRDRLGIDLHLSS